MPGAEHVMQCREGEIIRRSGCALDAGREVCLLPGFVTDNLQVRAYLVQNGRTREEQKLWVGEKQTLCCPGGPEDHPDDKRPLDVYSSGYKVGPNPPFG